MNKVIDETIKEMVAEYGLDKEETELLTLIGNTLDGIIEAVSVPMKIENTTLSATVKSQKAEIERLKERINSLTVINDELARKSINLTIENATLTATIEGLNEIIKTQDDFRDL